MKNNPVTDIITELTAGLFFFFHLLARYSNSFDSRYHLQCANKTKQVGTRGNWFKYVLWMDLANIYGAIPHKLVEEALNWYHISGKFMDIYYNGLLQQLQSESLCLVYNPRVAQA